MNGAMHQIQRNFMLCVAGHTVLIQYVGSFGDKYVIWGQN